ncbi:MAG TPA: MFS transporter [candidate division WOR-3 bacterium]|uniref:MFS transporter n=1 Tax=candidate division WOR-3 bacterium TaxID=2052148 RepID=A0A7V0T6P3_UNCW3|nr:MFS transporter [candidate division WOR-3 bacterium]
MLANLGAVLRIADFRRLVGVTTVSQLGDRLTHMLLITLIAVARPGRLFGYSEGALVFALPTLLLCPVVGVLVDRWSKRRTLAFTHFIQSGLLLATPLAIHLTGSFLPFWVALFLFFGLDLFNNTAAPALLPRLVGERRVLAANSASLALARVATIAGMVVGGFLLNWVGWNAGLVINAGTHLTAGLLALTIVAREPVAPAAAGSLGRALSSALRGFGRELAEVLRLVAVNRLIAFVLASIIVSTFISAVSYTVLIFLVQQVMGHGTAGVGIFAGVLAVGMVAGAVVIGLFPDNVNRPLLVLLSVLAFGLLFTVGWFHLSVPFLVAAALFSGVTFSWLGVVQTTMLQEQAAPGIRARIFAVREFVNNATFIASALLVGLYGDFTSYRHALAGIGLALIVLAALGFIFTRGMRGVDAGPVSD